MANKAASAASSGGEGAHAEFVDAVEDQAELEHGPHGAAGLEKVEEGADGPVSSEKERELASGDLEREDGAGGKQVDAEAEKRVVRKLDRNVVSLVTALYLLSFLDRSNIGNAEIAGMEQDLGLVNNDHYEWLLTIFYISYILGEVQIIMWKIVKPHYWMTFVVFGWGVIATCQAAVQSWAGEMVLRLLLGLVEAGFAPGIPYLLSFFYLRHELGFRCGIFLSAAPLANTFAGALAYGITSGMPSFPSWRLLFLVEGLPTICMAPIAFFFLPDTPDQARFLSAEEKRIAKARGVRQAGKANRVGGLDFGDIGRTLLDAKAWFTALMYFSCNVSFASLPVFLPTILEELGYSSIAAQGLTAPPYFLSFLVTIASTYIADRTQQRAYTLVVLTLLGMAGYIILATSSSVAARYTAIFMVASGVFPAIGNILPWVMNNQGSDTRRGIAMVMLNVVGQCGPLLGTRLYPDSQAPRFVQGHAVCAAFMGFTTLLVLSLRTLLVWENGRLARAEAAGQVEKRLEGGGEGQPDVEAEEGVGVENYGAGYRYIL